MSIGGPWWAAQIKLEIHIINEIIPHLATVRNTAEVGGKCPKTDGSLEAE